MGEATPERRCNVRIQHPLFQSSYMYLCPIKRYNQTEVLKYLLGRPGIEVDVLDYADMNPLCAAVDAGHAEAVGVILANSDIDIGGTEVIKERARA